MPIEQGDWAGRKQQRSQIIFHYNRNPSLHPQIHKNSKPKKKNTHHQKVQIQLVRHVARQFIALTSGHTLTRSVHNALQKVVLIVVVVDDDVFWLLLLSLVLPIGCWRRLGGFPVVARTVRLVGAAGGGGCG